jgi:hypothetical protein
VDERFDVDHKIAGARRIEEKSQWRSNFDATFPQNLLSDGKVQRPALILGPVNAQAIERQQSKAKEFLVRGFTAQPSPLLNGWRSTIVKEYSLERVIHVRECSRSLMTNVLMSIMKFCVTSD